MKPASISGEDEVGMSMPVHRVQAGIAVFESRKGIRVLIAKLVFSVLRMIT